MDGASEERGRVAKVLQERHNYYGRLQTAYFDEWRFLLDNKEEFTEGQYEVVIERLSSYGSAGMAIFYAAMELGIELKQHRAFGGGQYSKRWTSEISPYDQHEDQKIIERMRERRRAKDKARREKREAA